MGGYDGHALSNDVLEGNLPVVEQGLRAFYKEMGDQGMLDNVTFVLISEFGRTISPNSGLGSDHGKSMVLPIHSAKIHLPTHKSQPRHLL
jgi:uncharacterized protein (DUF1501 family)